jgi:bla regulator protein blaR1
MKSLLVAAFTICSCVFVYAQQAESSKETRPIQPSKEVTSPSVIPEPLFVIAVGGIEKEISTEELEKLNITQVASVEMLVDNELLKQYGEKGKNGVMIISLREDL